MNNTWAISSSIAFNLSGHISAHPGTTHKIIPGSNVDSRDQSSTQKIAAHANSVLPISIQSVYSFEIIVPVVQRIERRFPKGKLAFLQGFADVISSEQMTDFKRVE
jgi:hypothetical protein